MRPAVADLRLAAVVTRKKGCELLPELHVQFIHSFLSKLWKMSFVNISLLDSFVMELQATPTAGN